MGMFEKRIRSDTNSTNGQRKTPKNFLKKKSKKRNLETAYVIDIQSYGEISECKNLKSVSLLRCKNDANIP